MARKARLKSSRNEAPAKSPEPTDVHPENSTPIAVPGRGPFLIAVGAAAVALPVLRWFAVVHWAWAIVLAPFTAIGAATTVGVTFFLYRDKLVAVRRRIFGGPAAPVGQTPPPERLDVPQVAVEAGESILAEHPEILAALCHGFRMKKLMASVLGQPVTDPWAVYQAALVASPTRFGQLRILAATHTAMLAKTRRTDGGSLSDATAMRMALDAFRPCAQKAEVGRGHPDCPFEHVTVIFGAESPNRDANLRSIAPKVRALLERQYPQLKTAQLSDGSHVKFAEWQRTAAHDRAEISRLRRDEERQIRTIEELRVRLSDGEARVDTLTHAAESQRREAQGIARAEQELVVADLRAAISRAERDHTRDAQRQTTEFAKLSAAHDALAAERDALELALLTAGAGSDETDQVLEPDIHGLRVLLVGGESRQIAPLREYLESRGAQLLHDDSVMAAEHVSHVNVVVFWIRYLSHPTYFGVRQKVRTQRTPHAYWSRTSAASLVALVASTAPRSPS
jgi:hypothetical protein